MKKHFNKRLLALILLAILLICACPLSVFASELNGMNTAAMPGSGGDGPPSDSTGMSDIDLGFDLDIDENFDTDISAELTEDIKLRDTFTKHYTDGKGKYYAVVFPEQVHYLENGEWKEIDNSLTLNKQGNAYISGNKSFKTGFSKSSSSAELVTIEEGMYKLSWGISFDTGSELKDVISSSDIAMNETGSMTPVNARLTENRSDRLNEKGTTTRITKENIGDLGKAFSGISYDGVLGDKVDLRYSVLHGKVKEDVILNSASDFRSYTLTVNTYGLNATKLPDNRVSFKNSDGETIFTIGTPWMKDSDASVSDNIAVTVIQNGTTAYIKYEPDREWLNDAERVYPVLIDPDVTTRTFKSNYIDTYVYEGDSASSARANEPTMIVGNKNNKKYYSYIKFLDVPDLSSYYYYTSKVTLTFWAETTSSPSLSVYQVNASWNPNTITYASQPSSSLIISEQTGRAIGSRSRYAIDMTNFVNSWLYDEDDYYSNPTEFFTSSDWNGFKIGYTSDLPGNYTQICTSESTYSGLRPTLTFEYEYINPSCINDGAIYSFINSASGKYLTVDNGNITAGTNIYQYTKNNSRSQAFRIEKDSYYDYLRIVSMCNDDGDPQSLLSFCYDATITESGYTYQNAELEDNDDDSEYNDLIWYIIPHNGSDSLFKIVSGADPNLALTAYGTANGTASGTTNTSAGNVFVSRFTGASNQLWKLESGGCQVLNYTEDIRDVTQHKTVSESSTTLKFGLLVENFGDYISWASTNTAVAAVDYSGKVTAKKAGTARIYAHVYYVNGSEAEYSVTVYVTLANNTYYINNVDNNFRIEYENMTDLSENAVLEVYNNGTDEPTNRSRMFKIKHLGNSVYSIRSMLDNSMGWTNVSGKLVMTTIGTSDSAIPENAKWKINSNSNGYCFVSMASSQGHAVTSPTSSGGDLTVNSYSASAKQSWTIKPITASYHGVTIKNKTSNLAVGKSFRFSAVVYSTNSSNYHSSRVTWSASSKTGNATINSATGLLTGVSLGSVMVTATYEFSSYQRWSDSYTVVIKERYLAELVDTYGFSSNEATLIRSLYDKVDNIFSSENNLQRAWKCSRLLGGIIYGNETSSFKPRFKWKDVAGQVFTSTEKEYFTNVLGYSEAQYDQLRTAIVEQHSDTSTPDFAHYQISLSARLAYQLGLHGFASNLGTFCSDEDVSYLAGWLGDATILKNGTTSLGNDDYCADLDAENTFRYILNGYSSVNAISEYFCALTGTTNRATIFLNYISYDVVCDKVFYELIDSDIIILIALATQNDDYASVNYYNNLLYDEEYHWNTIQKSYPDTYDFLISLRNKLANLGGY